MSSSTASDSRKFNVRALFASQLAGDLLRVPGFASLVNAVFVGRTDDEEAQAEALRLLRVPTEVGYEEMLGTLSPRPRHDDRPDDTPRQFVFADGHGGVEKIRIDLEGPHLEHLRDTLDTNPDARRVRPLPSSSPGTGSRPVPPETDAERTGPVPVVPASGPLPTTPGAPQGPARPAPPRATARVSPVTPSRDPLAERTVVEGTVLDERHDGGPAGLDAGIDDLVPDLDDDLGGDDEDAAPAVSTTSAPAGDDEWAEAWVMDESAATGDAVGELADDADRATVTTAADRNPGWREGSQVQEPGRWVNAGRSGPGAPG